MTSLSGTVTFLFTDIEGSTKPWEAYPQAMRQARSLDRKAGDATRAATVLTDLHRAPKEHKHKAVRI